ncbi:MAG: type III-A CRISPR-associated protein Cas10/Csm1 [Lachnospiraceae bacterium]
MDSGQISCIIAGLLHDIGSVVYSSDKSRTIGQLGQEFVRKSWPDCSREILDSFSMSGWNGAEKNNDCADLAGIVNTASVIASESGPYRKDSGRLVKHSGCFEVHQGLRPIFNILNGNHADGFYEALTTDDGEMHYPVDHPTSFGREQYDMLDRNLSEGLRTMSVTKHGADALLHLLEKNLSYIPMQGGGQPEGEDISLYDHARLTAACAVCLLRYQEDPHRKAEQAMQTAGTDILKENVFLLASMDVSGIQKFIYTISSQDALRMLRARSFYLDILMEYVLDELLERLDLTRVNLLYSGGGHCYLLLPNTEGTRQTLGAFAEELNHWFLGTFGTRLYIAPGYAPCSADSLHNIPEGSYSEIFREVSSQISRKKSSRYSAEQIMELNSRRAEDPARECRACRESRRVNADGLCETCAALRELSKGVLYADAFTVMKSEGVSGGREQLKLPFGRVLIADTEKTLAEHCHQPGFVRTYRKNRLGSPEIPSVTIYTGDYTTGSTFEEFAQKAEGIKRLGVLRADVDNLGHAFTAGFADPENHDRKVSIIRTAALSRQLSVFFKKNINSILKNPSCSLHGAPSERLATIVYAGGDDLFIVGAWNDILELSIDIRRAFDRFTEHSLSLSAGIGLYHPTYPIHVIADETAAQEDRSKKLPGKNAVTLFEEGTWHYEKSESENPVRVSDGTWHWPEFENEVLGGKYAAVRAFFDSSEERGNAFLYRLLSLLRGSGEKINFARYVYLLARLEPDENASAAQREDYRSFSVKMANWIQNEKDKRQLITALEIYVYLHREAEEQ